MTISLFSLAKSWFFFLRSLCVYLCRWHLKSWWSKSDWLFLSLSHCLNLRSGEKTKKHFRQEQTVNATRSECEAAAAAALGLGKSSPPSFLLSLRPVYSELFAFEPRQQFQTCWKLKQLSHSVTTQLSTAALRQAGTRRHQMSMFSYYCQSRPGLMKAQLLLPLVVTRKHVVLQRWSTI